MIQRQRHPLEGAARLADPGVIAQLRLAWRLLRDPRVSGFKYLIPALLALYVGSPIDPIPDFVLGLGQIDDVGMVVLGILVCARLLPLLAPKDVVVEHVRDLSGRESNVAERQTERVVDAVYTVRG